MTNQLPATFTIRRFNDRFVLFDDNFQKLHPSVLLEMYNLLASTTAELDSGISYDDIVLQALTVERIIASSKWYIGHDACIKIRNQNCVYFITDPTAPDLVKIGMTSDLKRRLSALRWAVAKGKYQLVAQAIAVTDENSKLEPMLHEKLAHARVVSEWFKVDAVKSYLESVRGVSW